MQIFDITLQDVLSKKIWKITKNDSDDPLKARIVETHKVGRKNVVLHSAVLVERDNAVYPMLICKHYKDGGEVGDLFIHDRGHWKIFDPSIKLGETEGPYLAFISRLDIHEYQRGCFDNRRFHYERFEFYSAQIGHVRVDAFPTNRNKNSATKSGQQEVLHLRELLLHAKALHEENKISRGNKALKRASLLVEDLKSTASGRGRLRALLEDDDSYIRMTMMYQLLDIYRDECIALIRNVAKETSLEGIAARMNLQTIEKRGTLG